MSKTGNAEITVSSNLSFINQQDWFRKIHPTVQRTDLNLLSVTPVEITGTFIEVTMIAQGNTKLTDSESDLYFTKESWRVFITEN